MSKQITRINYDDMTVEDGGILYDMQDLARLSSIFDRLCLADYLLEWDEHLKDAKEAYDIADIIRERVEDRDDFESYIIEHEYDEIIDEYFPEIKERDEN